MRSRCSMRSMRRPAKPGPILAPAASLAGDAQTLSTALSAHDNATASGAMASILSDRDKIEAAAKIAGGQYPEQWTSIREKIAALEKQVPPAKGAVARSEVPESHASVAPPAGEKMPDAPKIEIASRVFTGRQGASERLLARHRSQVGREFSTARRRPGISTSRVRRASSESISISQSSSLRRHNRFASPTFTGARRRRWSRRTRRQSAR